MNFEDRLCERLVSPGNRQLPLLDAVCLFHNCKKRIEVLLEEEEEPAGLEADPLPEEPLHRPASKRSLVQRRQSSGQLLQEEDGFTFQPVINEVSRTIALLAEREGQRRPLVDLDYLQRQQNRSEAERSELAKSELRECSFRPAINGSGRKPSGRSRVHQQLYQQRLVREEHLNQAVQRELSRYSFRPSLKQTPRHKKSLPRQSLRSSRQQPAEARGKDFLSINRGRIKELSKSRAGEKAGNKSQVRPEVRSRQKAKQRVKQNVKQKGTQKGSQRGTRMERQGKGQGQTPVAVTVGIGRERAKGQVRQQLLRIFGILDSDSDGEISVARMGLHKLDGKLIDVLTPFFLEMKELGARLRWEEFCEAGTRLFQSLPAHERRVFLQARPDKR